MAAEHPISPLVGQIRTMTVPFLIAVVALAACVSSPLPANTAAVRLNPVPSTAIKVERPRFRMVKGELALEAYVFRQANATTTADSHIDLICRDAAGQLLREETTNFSPRNLPEALRLPGPYAYVLVAVEIEPGTATLDVRAHDGPHAAR